ncbi:MAG: ATP-binding cassette domain-containing protein [Desulfobacterales bacterium]|nr:ATP-binding cassette domain-containing protein [Desulfobacterales bacterium]
MIECKNISFRYPGAEAFVFEDLSFRMESPGFYALFGPSGVGKTSLAKIIVGDITNFSGEVHAGNAATLLYSYNLERLPGWSSVGSHLEKITPSKRKGRREELVTSFGLDALLGLRFSQLSLGQKNRVNLLRYLLQDFHFLIMDESLANVDEKTREKILLKIKEMFPESYFLYISHNVVEVSKFCKEIFVLRGSRKTVRTAAIAGLDLKMGQNPEKKSLELAMLEIMNAF